jgi:hypothetical protein
MPGSSTLGLCEPGSFTSPSVESEPTKELSDIASGIPFVVSSSDHRTFKSSALHGTGPFLNYCLGFWPCASGNLPVDSPLEHRQNHLI